MRYVTGLLVFVSPLLLACLNATAAETSTVDDVAMLAQKGLGEEALLAYVLRADGDFALSTDQVVKLKQAGVPEKVIVAMLRKQTALARGPEARSIVRQPQVVREECVADADTQTTVVYRPAYVPSYPYSSTYYPHYSSCYPSSYYYPRSYYSGYSSPWSLSFGFGGYRSWGGYCGHHR